MVVECCLLQVSLVLQTQRSLKCSSLSRLAQAWQLIIFLSNSDSISITLQQCVALSTSPAHLLLQTAHPQSSSSTNHTHCSSPSTNYKSKIELVVWSEFILSANQKGRCQRESMLIWRLVALTQIRTTAVLTLRQCKAQVTEASSYTGPCLSITVSCSHVFFIGLILPSSTMTASFRFAYVWTSRFTIYWLKTNEPVMLDTDLLNSCLEKTHYHCTKNLFCIQSHFFCANSIDIWGINVLIWDLGSYVLLLDLFFYEIFA